VKDTELNVSVDSETLLIMKLLMQKITQMLKR